MVKQRGVSLVVVLSLLSATLMLGVSSMQSAFIEERVSGNYRAEMSAQLGAEQGAAELMSWLKENGWPSSVDEHGPADMSSLLPSVDDSYTISSMVWSDSDVAVLGNTVDSVDVTFEGRAAGGDALAYLLTRFVRSDPNLIMIDGAFTCYGTGCLVATGSGQASNSINGNDHLVTESGCSIKGNNEPEENPDGTSKAGLIIPDGTYEEGGAGENIVGDPPVINDPEVFESNYGQTVGDADDELQEFIERMIGMADVNPGAISGMKNIAYAGVGQTIEVGDNAGGIIVLEGGTLEFTKGNTCFAGLVVARPGYDGSDAQVIVPSTIDSQGTTAILGGVIGDRLSYSGNGTPSVYYSSQSLDVFAGGSIGDGVIVQRWYNR